MWLHEYMVAHCYQPYRLVGIAYHSVLWQGSKSTCNSITGYVACPPGAILMLKHILPHAILSRLPTTLTCVADNRCRFPCHWCCFLGIIIKVANIKLVETKVVISIIICRRFKTAAEECRNQQPQSVSLHITSFTVNLHMALLKSSQ